jgi:hypothetical protein
MCHNDEPPPWSPLVMCHTDEPLWTLVHTGAVPRKDPLPFAEVPRKQANNYVGLEG